MSEPKLITPLLDNHAMGTPISSHHGVCCCPAMDLNTELKYIVKIISIPASQRQLEALLLSGAYPDKEAALAYFKELADDTVQEAEILQRLARLEGFTAYDSWQIIPMEDGVGYEVYLKSAYRPTLERYLSRSPMTHLAAVNLGLDLCAALSACRRSGYLYVDLKPGNVHICDDREYRLGDLGFISLSSLQYASLPEKYRSSYTAPEITDAYSSLNTTLDTYAAGLILYQVYNNGELPFEGSAPAEPLPPPPYADYEIAEIILKACAPDPKDRWEDPAQMGQALVSYMQRNSINDTPIIPPVIPTEPEITESLPEETAEEVSESVSEAAEAEETAEVEEAAEAEESAAAEKPAGAEISAEDTADSTEPDADASEEPEIIIPDIPEEAEESPEIDITLEPEETEPEADVKEAGTEESEAPEADPNADENDELAILSQWLHDETAPGEEDTAGMDNSLLSDETFQILSQADELISHTPPAPVVAPEPIDVPVPPMIQPEPEPEAKPETEQQDAPAEAAVAVLTEEVPNTDENPAEKEASVSEAPEEAVVIPAPAQIAEEPSSEDAEEEDAEEDPRPKKKHTGLIVSLVLILLLLLLGIGGYVYYTDYYLQSLDGITLRATESQLTVLLDTQIDNSLLTVTCTDSYGNVKHSSVENNAALFTGLRPDTSYKISVSIEGFHELIGVTTGTHSTAAQTLITGFTAVTGSEDGSVILNFTVQGPETSAWRIRYWALGVEEKTIDFTGHMVTVTGLIIGKHYTFKLEPATTLYLEGTDELKYTATKIIYAEELTTLGFQSGTLTATWKAPEGAAVNSWTVRCYNDAGYDTTITVTDTQAAFENLDPAPAYTIEVTAEGMTVGTRTYVSANSITFKQIQAESTNRKDLTVSWSYEGTAPKDGWLLLYSIDGSEQNVIQCDSAATSAVISPLIPDAHYEITVQPAGGGTVYGGTYAYDTSAAPLFSGYWVTCEHMDFAMCRRPEVEKWDQNDVDEEDYTTTFQAGEKASFVIKLNHEYTTSSDQIDILFVIRDANDVPVSFNTTTRTWTYMWHKGIGLLDVPALPEAAGNYTLEIYYNGASVTTQPFTIS